MADWNGLIPYTGIQACMCSGSFRCRIMCEAISSGLVLTPAQAGQAGTAGTAAKPWAAAVASPGARPSSATVAFNGWLYRASGMLDEDTNFTDTDDQNNPLPPQSNFYRLPFVRRQSVIPVFADATWGETFPQETDPVPADLNRGAGNASTDHLGRVCIVRHGKSVNVSFLDGHAENLKLQQLWTLDWHADWRTPTPLPRIP